MYGIQSDIQCRGEDAPHHPLHDVPQRQPRKLRDLLRQSGDNRWFVILEKIKNSCVQDMCWTSVLASECVGKKR